MPISSRDRGDPMTPQLAVQGAPEYAVPERATPERARDDQAATPQHPPRQADRLHTVVAVVGLGYVGLPTAIAMRNAGCRIIGIDISGARLDAIRDGGAELLESERADLAGHLQEDGFVLTDRIEALDAADLVLICVPTPVDEHYLPDLQILRDACAEVVRHARPGPDPGVDLDDLCGHDARAARAAARRARACRSGRTCSSRSRPSASTRVSPTTSN